MTTTPVPTCTDDLLAEIDVPRYDCTSGGVAFCKGCYRMEECEYGDYISVVDYAALLARLHAAEEEIGRRNAFQHEQMTFFTIPILRFAAEVGITDGEPKEKVQALIERMHAAEKDAWRYRWLRDMDCNSFSLSRNDSNAPNYMTAEEFIDTYPYEFSEVDPCELQRMKEENAIWCITIYPDTPIGSDNWQASSLDAAIDAAMEASK